MSEDRDRRISMLKQLSLNYVRKSIKTKIVAGICVDLYVSGVDRSDFYVFIFGDLLRSYGDDIDIFIENINDFLVSQKIRPSDLVEELPALVPESVLEKIIITMGVSLYQFSCTIDDQVSLIEQSSSKYKELFIKALRKARLSKDADKKHSKDKVFVSQKKDRMPDVGQAQIREMLGDCLVIVQISDIHFGKLHETNKDKESLTEIFLTLLARMDNELKPHFIIMNGDLTSMALDSEFKKAIEFINKLKKIGLRKNESKYSLSQRILVVPGNHDTRWLSKLKTDNLSRFRKYMKKGKLCMTSFSAVNGANVTQINNNGECEVPCAIYYYEEYGMIFLCLTSSYYSGKVSDKEAIKVMKEVYAAMKRLKAGKEKFKLLADIIRVDSGYISEEYIRSIVSTIDRLRQRIGEKKYKAAAKIALTHHPLSLVAQETAVCSKAGNLLEVIKEKDFNIVTHGHCHTAGLYNDTPHVKKANCIPVTTLSCSDQFSGLGFNVLAFDKHRRICQVFEWKLSADGNYKMEKNALNLRGEIKA